MPRKKKNDEPVTTPSDDSVAIECNVSSRYKGYSSFIINGSLMPIVDDKVTVTPEVRSLLIERGFVE